MFQGYRPWNICWSVSSWGSHGLCSKVIDHGTSVGLSAPGGVMDCVPRLYTMEHLLVCQLLGESWTVFQGYIPWNICWSVSSWGSHGLCSKVIDHGTSVGLSALGGVMDCVPRL